VKRFRGGLKFKAHRLLHHSTLGSRVIKEGWAADLEFAEGFEESLVAPREERRCDQRSAPRFVFRVSHFGFDVSDFRFWVSGFALQV
jgi:hypothetical protein